MPLISHFHPLLVHFPIALVMVAAAAELAAIATPDPRWRAVAIANVRAGAALGLLAAITGWLLASAPIVDATPALEWHRWLGLAGALTAAGAAVMARSSRFQSRRSEWTYRVVLFAAALLVAIAGHLGGTLVWGAEFLRP